MRNFSVYTVCLSSVLLFGCASWNKNDIDNQQDRVDVRTALSAAPLGNLSDRAGTTGTAAPLSLITGDFVNAMVQMRSMQPSQTTVSLLNSDKEDAFIRSMQRSLQDAGYGVRWVDDDVSNNLLQYRHEREAGDTRTHRDLFEVAVGVVEMRRSYRTDVNDKTSPVTPLYVRGTDASSIELNDDVFKTVPVHALTPPASVPNQRAAVIHPVPRKPVVPRTLPADANPLDGRLSALGAAPELSLPLIALPNIENVFELGGSNYEDLLAGYSVVKEQQLTFPNDSLRLGQFNKSVLNQMVERFNRETDVFSLVGCSIGPTAVKGGNAALALGRSSRVREALLFSGVPAGKILDEGCWAGDTDNRELLRRGVIVTLNRK